MSRVVGDFAVINFRHIVTVGKRMSSSSKDSRGQESVATMVRVLCAFQCSFAGGKRVWVMYEDFGNPIDGVNDWISEVAMLFASECSDEDRALATIGTKEAEKAALEAEIVAKGKERTSLESEKSSKEEEVEQTTAKYDRFGFTKPAGMGMLAGFTALSMGAGAVAGEEASMGLGFVLFLVYGGIFQWEKGKRNSVLPQLQSELSDIQSRLSGIDSALSEAKKKIETLTSEIAELQPSRGVEAVGRVYFPMLSTEIAGYPVLIDEAGLEPVGIADCGFDQRPGENQGVSNAVEKASASPSCSKPATAARKSIVSRERGGPSECRGDLHGHGGDHSPGFGERATGAKRPRRSSRDRRTGGSPP